MIQREALSLVNHLIDSPSKELEVGCSYSERNHFHISIKISFKCSLVFQISKPNQTQVSMSIFAVPVLNVLWEMVAGHAFQREDVEVQRILKMMNWVFTSKVISTVSTMNTPALAILMVDCYFDAQRCLQWQ